MKNIMKAAGVSLVVLSTSMFAHAAEAAQKIGYVNSAQIFQALPQREVVLQKMQEEFKDRAAELQTIQAQAKTKMEKLQRDGELLGQEEVEKLRVEISQLESNFQIKGKSLEQASARREAEEKQKLFKLIQDAVNKVAEKEGYDLIIEAQALQYAKPEYNISEKVIDSLK
ncbi:OmpH family outer membrane protein [Vibrio genomosp. F10]|uniref:Chaperone protein skp n=2 Tax=Vibrio genomosp. F10 TaxID=723171 RepID=A0A1B9R187_9VIBR|nr:OmpH family outer membrane protein [Vibrio genomosp. F10]OCH77952.1 molecular chaperone [Vibrio genomosp. F10]OEE38426.1 molecular chaperone [Vibrio genomosp. F10 str. ZF-129]OEE98246.1 molecular chaperone [Vibrio genomosp. F10 str. 9ZC157]OEF07817.1 molecular chaperone [Vibrio genomosp. F10 str. 9ZD137]OEF09148.1 molecular chaperone [Vibrio genomosp. F10 str. 9ZB36]